MAKQYWVQREGKTSGPFSGEQFAQMAAAEMIFASDMISTDRVQWAIAESFSGVIAQDKDCPEVSGQDDRVLKHSTEDQPVPEGEVSDNSSSRATDHPPCQADAKQSKPQRPQCTIHDAAAAGDIEQIKLHLSWGTDVNGADTVGHGPLRYAVRGAKLGAVELLLANGADVNSKGGDDQTPLYGAVMFSRAQNDSMEIIELLCAMGADVNVEDRWGRTPVSYAESVEIAEVLLDKGALDYICDNDLRTLLHHYASNGRTELVELFSRRCCYKGLMNIQDKQGKTPLELAEEGSEVAALLESSGAKRSPLWYRGPLTPRILHSSAFALFIFVGGGIWVGQFFLWWLPLIAIIGGFLAGYIDNK